MLQKKPLTGGKVEVTFRMPPLDDVVELYLSGEFNGWQVKAIPLSVETDGTWAATLVLDAGKSYRFRYHDNQGRWLDDGEADGSVANAFGSEDSVLDLTALAEEASRKHAQSHAKPKKAAAQKVSQKPPQKSPAARSARTK